jgi:hypothetical protein
MLSRPRAIVRLEGIGQLKNPMTSSGIEPATFRLVAFWKYRSVVVLPLSLIIGLPLLNLGTDVLLALTLYHEYPEKSPNSREVPD